MRVLRIGWLLARPARAGRSASVLPIVAFAVTSALLLTVLGGAQAFFSWRGEDAVGYQSLAVIALSLLIVPLISLGGAAARLSARRRDDRLATLRLLGAGTGLVAALTVIEATVLAVAGAVVGIVGYAALVPLVALIPFRGSPLGAAALWLSPLAVAAVIAAMAVIAGLSALLGLRQVVISPLGVRARQNPPRLHWVRLVAGLVVVAAAIVAVQLAPSLGGVVIMLAVLAAGFGGTLAVLGLVGPFVLRAFATRHARTAKTASRLIAARTVLESPKAAWRQVGGVAMTSFMAVFAGTGVAVMSTLGSGSADRATVLLVHDIRTGIILTVAISFLLVACSVAVNQTAGILDRRDLYVGLDRLGMPLTTMDAARRRAVLSPLAIVTIGSAVCAAVVVLPLAGVALVVAPFSLLTVAACLVAGVLIVWLGLVATRPVVRGVLAAGARLAD